MIILWDDLIHGYSKTITIISKLLKKGWNLKARCLGRFGLMKNIVAKLVRALVALSQRHIERCRFELLTTPQILSVVAVTLIHHVKELAK